MLWRVILNTVRVMQAPSGGKTSAKMNTVSSKTQFRAESDKFRAEISVLDMIREEFHVFTCPVSLRNQHFQNAARGPGPGPWPCMDPGPRAAF